MIIKLQSVLFPLGDSAMLQVAGYGLAIGAAAGLLDGILLGYILKLILRKPKSP